MPTGVVSVVVRSPPMMEWRAVWRGVRSAEKQLSALLESGVPTAAKELTTHNQVRGCLGEQFVEIG